MKFKVSICADMGVFSASVRYSLETIGGEAILSGELAFKKVDLIKPTLSSRIAFVKLFAVVVGV